MVQSESEEEATRILILTGGRADRALQPPHSRICQSSGCGAFRRTSGFVPAGNIVPGVFTPVLAKHTKHLSLVDVLSIGVDRIQRNLNR